MEKTTDEMLNGLPTAISLWRQVDREVSSSIGTDHPIYDVDPEVGDEGAIGRFTDKNKRWLQWLLIPHALEVRLVLYPGTGKSEGPQSLSFIVNKDGIQSAVSATNVSSEEKKESTNFDDLLPIIHAMVGALMKT